MKKRIALAFVAAVALDGCSYVRYSHQMPDGSMRSFAAIALGSTTAVQDATWKVGDSDLHIGEANQDQPLGKILGEFAGAAVKAAR